ncbi:MAG: iron-sulfur cluster assembly scaffold protein [Sphingomonadales bacterium]|nr:iron-sulfur cluster assembly scaffold protein [Sphingomonadales bacterium]MDE2570197.1 iron-sulfur cluster assembly scaffold protein [Sphingomonadales bacterium]
MASRAAAGLYTPDILAAATRLAAWPWNDALPLNGAARSPSCGSSIALALDVDAGGRIAALGIRPHACAVGQAAASVFAAAALGMARDDIATARQAIATWLSGEGGEPRWPGIALIAPACAYPARHAAILLAWDAALDALPAHR